MNWKTATVTIVLFLSFTGVAFARYTQLTQKNIGVLPYIYWNFNGGNANDTYSHVNGLQSNFTFSTGCSPAFGISSAQQGGCSNGTNSYISSTYNYDGNLTMLGWYTFNVTPSSPTDFLLFNVGSSTKFNDYWASYYNNAGTLQLTFDRLRQNVANDVATYNVTLSLGVPYCIAETYDGASVYGYLNGVSVASVSSSNALNGSGGTIWPLTTGAPSAAIGPGWAAYAIASGTIDDFQFYQSALTPSQIARICSQRSMIGTGISR